MAEFKYPAIHDACETLNLKLLQSELRKGVDPNLISPFGETPLMLCFAAIMQPADKCLPLVRTLVDSKASVNAVNQRTKKPVLYYYLDQEPDIVEFLLDRGAKMDEIIDEIFWMTFIKPPTLYALFQRGANIHPTHYSYSTNFPLCCKLSKLQQSENSGRH